MRKIALIFLIILLVMPAVRAESLPLAAVVDAFSAFERYQSYQMDEESGEWSAHGLITQQLLGTVEQGAAADYLENGVCILYPGLRGDRDLSLAEPMLYVCLLRNAPIKAEALSIATGGVRYDFVAPATETKRGGRGEQFALPLDGEGLSLLRSFAREGGEVRVYGETQIYRTRIVEAEKYANARLRVEALSMGAAREFLTLWPDDYALWDRNAARWEKERPKMAAAALSGESYAADLPALEPTTQCLDARRSAAVKAYQQLLKDNAFFTANPDARYGKATRAATKQAQQYYGLLPTGMADRALIERLRGLAPSAAPAASDKQTATPGLAHNLEGRYSLTLTRAWLARSLSPSRSAEPLDRLWPADRSNRLYIADGEIVNLSAQTMRLPLTLQACVRANGVDYPCAIRCERDEGRAFGSSLLPLGKTRLVVFCELPKETDFAACTLYISAQETTSFDEI